MRRLEERWGIMNNLIGASRLDVVQGVGGGQSSSCHLFYFFSHPSLIRRWSEREKEENFSVFSSLWRDGRPHRPRIEVSKFSSFFKFFFFCRSTEMDDELFQKKKGGAHFKRQSRNALMKASIIAS